MRVSLLKAICCIFFMLAAKSVVEAQVTIRKYSNEFLNLGAGARGMGMSNVQTALASDVTAGYYNPAGLTQINNAFQFTVMHAEYFAGIAKWDYGAFAVPTRDRKHCLGFSFFRFGVDDIPNTLFLVEPDGNINYDNITSFNAADYAFMLHYARGIEKVKGLSLGVTAKVIYRHTGSFARSFGFGADVGLQYRWKGLRAGFMAQDVTGTFNAWSFGFSEEEQTALLVAGQQLPVNNTEVTSPSFKFGVGYEVGIRNKVFFTPAIDLILTTDGRRNVLLSAKPISMDMSFALEVNLFRIGYLRAGLQQIQRSTDEQGSRRITLSPNSGAGVYIKIISLDYALTNLTTLRSADGGAGLYSHVVSIRLDINKKVKEP